MHSDFLDVMHVKLQYYNDIHRCTHEPCIKVQAYIFKTTLIVDSILNRLIIGQVLVFNNFALFLIWNPSIPMNHFAILILFKNRYIWDIPLFITVTPESTLKSMMHFGTMLYIVRNLINYNLVHFNLVCTFLSVTRMKLIPIDRYISHSSW